MIKAMTQGMACLYNSEKDPSKKLTSMKPTGGMPLFRKVKTSRNYERI